MVQLQELTIDKDKIFEFVNELLEPSNVAILEFVKLNIGKLSLNLNRSLIDFTIGNDINAVEILLNLGADISTRDGRDEDYTPLHWAVYKDEAEMVKFLLDHGADIEEITNDVGATALHLAAHKGSQLSMKVLLENGANVNPKDESGKTPLHEAAGSGNKAEAQLLIQYGADVKAISDNQTPADCARSSGHYNVARWLMEVQTGVKQRENSHISVEPENKSKITQFLKRLLQPDKIQVLEFLQNNMRYFEKSLNTSLAEAAMDGDVILTEIFLDHGADIATIDDDKNNDYTPFHWAAYNSHTNVVEYLLDHGADIEQKTIDYKETALHIAAQFGRMEVLNLLLERGANVNVKDKLNKTPLHTAASNGKRLAAALLIKYGADIKAVSDDKTAADYAKINNHENVAKWLNWKMEMMQNKVEDTTDELSTKNKIKNFLKELIDPHNQKILDFLQNHLSEISENINKPLSYLVRVNMVLEIDVLLALGADISIKLDDYTPLHWTAYHGITEMAKFLLDRGANIEEQSLEDQATPLHVAASRGEIKILKLLLDRGANVNAKMKDNKTPLHEAENADVADMLITYGADVEAESQNGTPLHIVAYKGRIEVLKVLVKRGANVHARNNMNRTPLHEAAGCGHCNEAELLVKFGADVEATSNSGTPAEYARLNGYVNFSKWLTQITEVNKDTSENKHAQASHITINNEEFSYKNKLKKVLEELLRPSNIEILEFFERYFYNYQYLNNLNVSLHTCVADGDIMGAEILLDLGAEISSVDDENHFTPLHSATYYCHTEMVKFLLDQGADIEETTQDNEATALHLAVHEGYREIIKLLLERGANVNAKDSSSNTPLHEAARMGHRGDAELLIKYGADIKAGSESGTPADCARINDFHDFANWLNSL